MTPVTTVPETISIRGAAPVQLSVRVTRHGPLVSGCDQRQQPERRGAARPAEGRRRSSRSRSRWTALDADDSTLVAFLKLNEAHDWTEFTDALRSFVVPSQNFVYADVDGHIGYYAPGRIPVRASGDGSRPAEGWTGKAEWTGWVPFDELPHLFDPPSHEIVTANHRPAPADYPHHLGLEWPEPYRAQRITDLAARRDEADARRLCPHPGRHRVAARENAAAAAPRARAPARQTAARRRGAAPALERGGLRRQRAHRRFSSSGSTMLVPTIVGDDLGPLVTKDYRSRFSFATRFLVRTLTDPQAAAWCDDRQIAGGRDMRRRGDDGASVAPSRN